MNQRSIPFLSSEKFCRIDKERDRERERDWLHSPAASKDTVRIVCKKIRCSWWRRRKKLADLIRLLLCRSAGHWCAKAFKTNVERGTGRPHRGSSKMIKLLLITTLTRARARASRSLNIPLNENHVARLSKLCVKMLNKTLRSRIMNVSPRSVVSPRTHSGSRALLFHDESDFIQPATIRNFMWAPKRSVTPWHFSLYGFKDTYVGRAHVYISVYKCGSGQLLRETEGEREEETYRPR